MELFHTSRLHENNCMEKALHSFLHIQDEQAVLLFHAAVIAQRSIFQMLKAAVQNYLHHPKLLL